MLKTKLVLFRFKFLYNPVTLKQLKNNKLRIQREFSKYGENAPILDGRICPILNADVVNSVWLARAYYPSKS